MSAALSAGASFTPSPVIATTKPPACSSRTMRSLNSGVVRAKTVCERIARRRSGSSIASSSLSVTALSRSPQMPMLRATATAVSAWSPVIITTLMPARRQALTAS